MITVFNRKLLFTDTNAEAAANVWSALREANIPYEMKTLQNHTTFGKNLHYHQAAHWNAGGMGAAPYADNMSYVYKIFVRKSDYARAVKLCDLQSDSAE